ncbi:MAG: hypothetical protein AAF585_09055 [Verrucomicrobiota bacterium]
MHDVAKPEGQDLRYFGQGEEDPRPAFVLREGEKYTYSDYFNVKTPIDEILGQFGFGFEVAKLDMPRCERDLPGIDALIARMEAYIPLVRLNSECGRREFLVAPILSELAIQTKAIIKSEFALDVSDALQGRLDFLVEKDHRFIVVEAKYQDFENGYKQLAMQLVALAESGKTDDELLWGAVTTGQVWYFVCLDQPKKVFLTNTDLFVVPQDIEELLRRLVGIVEGESPKA